MISYSVINIPEISPYYLLVSNFLRVQSFLISYFSLIIFTIRKLFP